MKLFAIACPCCRSKDVMRHTLYTTQNHGERAIYRCKSCREYFSETTNTFLARIKKPISTIIHVIKARTEGMALNAVCRTFELSKNTVLKWEERFTRIKQTLLLQAGSGRRHGNPRQRTFLGRTLHGSLGGIGRIPFDRTSAQSS